MTNTTATAPVRITSVEPGGIEAIPSNKRHGSPWQLIATWTAPNLEFATVFVGVIAIAFFGLGFWQAIAAVVLGNALGALTQGVLSTWGPREGLAQLVLSRTAFGSRGNILPSAINALVAGLGWFAVNSVSGAFALATLTGIPVVVALIIVVAIEIVVAFVGHDLIQFFERYSTYVLGAIFIVATVTVFMHANLGFVQKGGSNFSFAGFTLATGAAFGYAAGWNPYASDYSRYLKASTSKVKIGVAAGLGNFISCTVLMAAGAAATTIAFKEADPTGSFVSSMPIVIRDLTLVAIAIGAISANALNVYSGAMSFLAAGIKIPFALRRAIIAALFGVVGFFIAWSAIPDAGTKYTGFLLVIAYWIAPWLGVVFVDRWLRRGTAIAAFVPDKAKYRNPAGIVAFVIATGVSIFLFANQYGYYQGPVAVSTGTDLTALVGFALAAILYFGLFQLFKPTLGGPVADEPDLVIGVDAADTVA